MDPSNAFSALHLEVRTQGLLRKQPQYYNRVIIRTLLSLAAVITGAIAVRAYSSNFLLEIPLAIALGFVFGQFGFLAHDTGHGQIGSILVPQFILRYFSNIFVYGSLTGWRIKHDIHHNEPNDTKFDPDCDIPTLAFTYEQAEQKSGFKRWLVKYQAYLFVPISCLTVIGMRITSIQYLLKNRMTENMFRELLLSAFSLATYIALWSAVLGFWQALAFMLICEFTFGFYMGMTFVTNHYGMSFDVAKEDGFLTRQVTTTRNIGSSFRISSIFLHFLYGGLNYQIEHHLWPYMPRCNLRYAAEIVRSYCTKAGITHHTATPFQAYKEVFLNFADIGTHVRAYDRKNVH